MTYTTIDNINVVDRLTVDVHLDGIPVRMDLDTGAKASLIGKPLFEKHFRRPLKSTVPLGS